MAMVSVCTLTDALRASQEGNPLLSKFLLVPEIDLFVPGISTDVKNLTCPVCPYTNPENAVVWLTCDYNFL